jgi:hypothetical protein
MSFDLPAADFACLKEEKKKTAVTASINAVRMVKLFFMRLLF